VSVITRTPTSNTTPDPGQGGAAVTGADNNGHGSTTVSQVISGTSSKSCIWSGFAAVTQQIKSIKIKFDYTEDGTIVDGTTSFRVQYSINGGGAFTTIFDHIDVAAPNSASSETTLPNPSQDITQIQVRDRLQASSTPDVGGVTLTTSISNIQVEVTLADSQILVMM
jgi:hypothetical protein